MKNSLCVPLCVIAIALALGGCKQTFVNRVPLPDGTEHTQVANTRTGLFVSSRETTAYQCKGTGQKGAQKKCVPVPQTQASGPGPLPVAAGAGSTVVAAHLYQQGIAKAASKSAGAAVQNINVNKNENDLRQTNSQNAAVWQSAGATN